ncbi:Protein NRT1/ PTR FAMILY 4.6 [Linum perenne]
MELEGGRWDGYVDWRNRPAIRGRHGGMLAASFVLGAEVMENLAFLANASNLVMYMAEYMHFTPSKSAVNVTNFMGTAFLLALLGGFLSDAFFTTYQIYLISATIEFLGLVILTIQAKSPTLKPQPCTLDQAPCHEVAGGQAAMLFIGLYLVALGVGGIKGSLPPHGAEQFDDSTPKGRKQRSTFFNYFVFCLSCGALIAVTFVVWVEDNKGWEWGFGLSTIAIFVSIPLFLAGSGFYRSKVPSGSPLTTIFKVCLISVLVLISASINKCIHKTPSNAIANHTTSPTKESTTMPPPQPIAPSNTLTFLNNATLTTKPFQCTIHQVEDVKIVLKILPIFASTIMLNCCLAQLSTFSVQQASTMDTKLASFKVPPASLPIFPVVFIMILAPIYDHFIIPFARRVTKSETGITHLQRIGVGLVLSIVAMAVAALVEIKRKRVASEEASIVSPTVHPLPITFLWIAIQYLFLGSADLFTLAGLLEFFFSEAPSSMRSLATSLSWASLAMGYYLSSVIVSVVNGVTRGHGPGGAWLSGKNINEYHLEGFYWLMCVLSVLNFGHYLFWACKYKYRATGTGTSTSY